MSEHWKSTPKYWCKHCSIYVKDTPFEKKQHEATGKHQGNLRRFLNGIQKNHAKSEREKDHAKAEVERLNRIAGGSSSTKSEFVASSSQSSKSSRPSSATLSAADQKRQWAQLTEMGIAAPGSAGPDNATPGGWQTVSRKVVQESPQDIDEKLNIGVRKRKFEDREEEEEAGETVTRRGWGSTTRTYPGSTSTSDDLNSLLAASVFNRKVPRESAEQYVKPTTLSTADSNLIVQQAEEDEIVSPLSLEPASTGVADTTNISPSDHEDKLPVSHASEPETTAPVFKKRRPKRSAAT